MGKRSLIVLEVSSQPFALENVMPIDKPVDSMVTYCNWSDKYAYVQRRKRPAS